MTSPHTSEEAMSLVFQPHMRVAGDVIEGEVKLNFRLMQHSPYERIQVKLFGSIFTRVAVAVGFSSHVTEETAVLVRDSKTLWKHGEAYPPARTDVLALPFRFTLRSSGILPSSRFDNRLDLAGKVIYWVEVVGLRSSLNFNKRIPRPFPVLPLDSAGAELSRLLKAGWTGPWKQHVEVKSIRKGVWGEYSNAKWTLTLPAIDVFPVLTPIPFTLNIVTVSKPMKPQVANTEEPIFPVPPNSAHAGVELKLVRDVSIKAQLQDKTSFGTFVAYVGGLGHGNHTGSVVQTDVQEPVWLPDIGNEKKQLGSWKQEVTFKSTIMFQCAPTFKSDTFSLNYTLQPKVEFAGVGNSVKGRILMQLVSNMNSDATRVWDGPPPDLDLPPEYFSSTDWTSDEKTEKHESND